MENSLNFSVIIPVYNGSDYLGETIVSVLKQTYKNYEVIVVDDASIENTSEVVHRFKDSRIKFIQHKHNQGANIARNTGIRASTGDVIAFLDQDDYFHPDKLQSHARYLSEHPEVGFTYNSRFNLNHSSNTIRNIWRPSIITLKDLVLGFPLSPSDMVVRREWLFRAGLWDETRDFNGGEITLTGRLFLSGCRFAGIQRVLNYRRYYSGRRFGNLAEKCKAEISAQERVLSDPRCPAEVKAIQNRAFANSYMIWAYVAFIQQETKLGQDFIREAIRLVPTLLAGNPNELVNLILENSTMDESEDHEILMRRVFFQLPTETKWTIDQLNWAISQGFLIKGARALIWERLKDARFYFTRAKELKTQVDERFVNDLTYQLFTIKSEYGDEHVQKFIKNLTPYLKDLGNQKILRLFKGCYSINQAFSDYHEGRYSEVPYTVFQAILNEPRYLKNRGVITILLRSMMGIH